MSTPDHPDPQTAAPPSQRRQVLSDVLWSFAAVALALWLGNLLASWGGHFATLGGLLGAGAMIGVPLLLARWRRLGGDVLAVDPPLGPAAWAAVVMALVVLPVYAIGYDAFQIHVARATRGAGPGLASQGLDWQAEPPARVSLGLVEARGGVVVVNRTGRTEQARVRCPGVPGNCHTLPLDAGGRVLVPLQAGDQLELAPLPGGPPPPAQIGASGEVAELPLRWDPGYLWLLTLLLVQVAAVALPEELLFRGFILGRLRELWPPQRTVLGVPFGLAHVVSAALFALIHLITVPAPFRLAVFFPGLLFGWLAQRTGSAVSAAVLHALCNVCLQVLQRLYG